MDLEALHRPAEGDDVRRLDHEVDVVALHRDLDQAVPEPLAAALERLLEGAKAAVRPQVPDLAAQGQRDVQRTPAKLLPGPMRNIPPRGLPLPPRPPPRASPPPQRQLLLFRFHSASVQRGSDIPRGSEGAWTGAGGARSPATGPSRGAGSDVRSIKLNDRAANSFEPVADLDLRAGSDRCVAQT